MENKPVLWDKNSEALPSLRQPNLSKSLATQDNRTVDSDSNMVCENRGLGTKSDTSINTFQTESKSKKKEKNFEDIIAKSTLKVDAPEWFPSNSSLNICAQLTTNTVQDRLKVYKKNNESDLQSLDPMEKSYSSNLSVQHYNSDDSIDIIRLKQIINTLTRDPGQFDNLLDLFMETLLPYFDDIMALSVIAQLLVEQAINNSNFRYTGARLCWYVEQNCPAFRAEIPLKCKKQLEENINKQNVVLFIAELYTQLPHLNVYGALLIDSFKQLLIKGGNDDIKCICQALKLTGYSLEQNNKTSLDEVFSGLKSVTNTTTGSVTALVNSVINLRNSNWGYSSDTTNNADPVSDGIYYDDLQSTVFYDTDGHTFTNEENEFLAAHMDSNAEYLSSDNSDPDDLCDPEPEMDEEIQAAFKEFVKFSRH